MMKPSTRIKIIGSLIASCRNLRLFSTAEYKSIPRESVDAVLIGAGAVGIAVARELATRYGREVVVLESASTFGTGSSSRNSEVIHAGIYYQENSLKALFCVRGRHLLYKYCKHDIPHKQIGKLIVATRDSEIPKLNALMTRGINNGVENLLLLDGDEAKRIEPELQCVKALSSPVSGIVDSHSLMLSLMGEAETHGTIFSYNTTVTSGHLQENRIHLHISESNSVKNRDTKSPPNPNIILVPNLVVNSAGLGALALSKRINGLDHRTIPTPYFARGCYFTLSNVKTSPFQHLIYPIPEDGGLGVHVTLDLNGRVKFGLDVEWIDGGDDISRFLNLLDYSVPGVRADHFYPEIRKYYPNLKDGTLEPGFAGIRPKLSGPRQSPTDFVIQGEDIRGIPGFIDLFWHRIPWTHGKYGNCRACGCKISISKS